MTTSPDSTTLPQPGRWAVSAVLLLGMLATLVLSLLLAGQDAQRSQIAVEARTREAAQRIDAATLQLFDLGFAIRGLVALHPDLTAEIFRRFVADGALLQSYPSVSAISFATWFPGATPGDGKLLVSHIEPLDRNRAAIGLDLMQESTRREAVTRARDRGIAVASAPLQTVQDPDGVPSVLLIVPVYAGGQDHDTAPERRRAFLGAASIVVPADRMLSDVAPEGQPLDLWVDDVGPVEADGPQEASRLIALGSRASPPQDAITVDTSVGDRRWRVTAAAVSTGWTGIPAWLVTAIAGSILTLMLTALVFTQRSERWRAEQLVHKRTAELRSANQALELASDAQSAFLGTVSHELRTPLTAINGFLLLLGEPVIIDDPVRRDDLLARMSRNATSLTMLIEELLAFSRLEALPDRLSTERVDLARLVGDGLHALEPLLATATINRHLDEDVLAQVDPDAMQRILANLMTNAAKYGGPSVTIDVRVRKQGRRAVLDVIDDGPGVSEADAPHVFEQFRRGSNTAGTAGNGIGLAAVADLVRRMGGNVQLQADHPRGAHFMVEVPLAFDDAASNTTGLTT